ncbi:MAG: Gfo/Idh/MocA family oxidoreductase [Bacillota bacterium]|jgi:predicted dehydrogenase
MERLKVGVIGTGMGFERLHYPAFQELSDYYQVAAVCDRDRFKAEKWGRILGLTAQDVYTDYREIARREDLQVIDIIVPIELNFKIAETVAQMNAGAPKALILEKPLAPTLEQAKAAAALPRQYRIMMMIAENYRYNEEINLIRDLIREGQLGEVDFFQLTRVFNLPDDMEQDTFAAREWRQHPHFPGGVFYDSAVHDLAAVRHIFGALEEVMAYGQKKAVTPQQYTVVNAILKFKSGFTGSYTFASACKEWQRPLSGLRIFGRTGELYLEERDAGVINITYNDGTSQHLSYQPRRGYYNEFLNLYNAFTGKEALAVTAELEYGDARATLAILESIANETPVKVDAEAEFQPFDRVAAQQDRQPTLH